MIHRSVVCAVVLGAAAAVAVAQEGAKARDAGHVLITPAQITWGDAPPSMPKGAQVAVLSGDPSKSGPFVMRAKFPPGYRIMPHWHPVEEQVTVLAGVFSLGKGDTFDQKALHTMPRGSFSVMPAEMRHFAFTGMGATIQVNGNGPFVLNYVNAADDPRNAAAPAK